MTSCNSATSVAMPSLSGFPVGFSSTSLMAPKPLYAPSVLSSSGVGARRSLSSVKAVFSASIFWRRWVFLLNAIFEKYLDGSRQFGIEQFVVGRVGEVVREVVLLQHPAAEEQQA